MSPVTLSRVMVEEPAARPIGESAIPQSVLRVRHLAGRRTGRGEEEASAVERTAFVRARGSDGAFLTGAPPKFRRVRRSGHVAARTPSSPEAPELPSAR